MALLAFGINHKTAPVDVREKVAFSTDKLEAALRDLIARGAVNECAIVSTCNRTELYCGFDEERSNVENILNWFREYHDLDSDEIEPYLYTHLDNLAVQQDRKSVV